ncbi:MAG: hypothetical protein EOO76_14570 [Novosphingobium sp.]|nr:MAG: hypothetical protein EOO76_14570 [Novosphingobium sp.]
MGRVETLDPNYFLKDRTRFIRFYYEAGTAGFADVKRRIEFKLSPYDNPPYSEDSEPPYLVEWIDAEAAMDVLGLSCVSLLSDSLKLYFNTLRDRVLRFSFDKSEDAILKRNGFPAAYRAALGPILDTDWSDCPADFDVIEQVVLARNKGQHGEDITSFRSTFDRKMLARHPLPIFANSEELSLLTAEDGSLESLLMPSIKVSREALFGALEEVDILVDWIEGRREQAEEWVRKQRSSR